MKIEEKKKIVEYLEIEGWLEYGKVIPAEIFEQLFGAKVDSGWSFLGPFMSIKESLEEAGFLGTSENMRFGCLRIFDADEIAYRADNIMKNLTKRLKKLQMCMLNTKLDEFNQKEYQMHLHAQNKVCAGLNSLSSSLAGIH